MSDMLSDEFSGLLYATAQYAFARTAYNRRAGATPRNFGRLRAHKMGSLPPGLVLFLRHFSHSRVVYFLVSRDLCASQREEDGEDEDEVSNSYLLHLLRPNSRRARAYLEEASCWAGATHDLLWPRHRGRRWCRSSPTWCHSAAQFDLSVVRNFFSFGHLLHRESGREGDG